MVKEGDILIGKITPKGESDPTPEEMAEIQTFMEPPLGVKYMEVNNTEGAGSAMEVINAPINAEFKRCNIDIEL